MQTEQAEAEVASVGTLDVSPSTSSGIDTDAALKRMRESTRAHNDVALAEYLKVPYPTIASWRRRRSIPISTFIAVAERTGATLDWLLLGRSGATPPPVIFNLNDAAFDYAVAFALVSRGIDVREYRDFPDLIRSFYSVVDGTLESLDGKGLSSQEDRRRELERQLARLIEFRAMRKA